MKRFYLTLALVLSLLATGCASEKKVSENGSAGEEEIPYVDVPDTEYVPPGDGPGQGPGPDSNWRYGATAALSFDSHQVLSEYIMGAVNSPREARINVNLERFDNEKTGRVTYGGTVTISYRDNVGEGEGLATGHFTSGHSASETRYNVWFEKSGTEAFHGFFTDHMGALILVLDGPSGPDLGDGSPRDKWGGSVWFKNFDPKATFFHPPTRCWFVSRGPYDCRSWISGKGVDTFRSINPDSGGYKRLGRFSGLDLKKAFNNADIVFSRP